MFYDRYTSSLSPRIAPYRMVVVDVNVVQGGGHKCYRGHFVAMALLRPAQLNAHNHDW